jgi:hypothetical protein
MTPLEQLAADPNLSDSMKQALGETGLRKKALLLAYGHLIQNYKSVSPCEYKPFDFVATDDKTLIFFRVLEGEFFAEPPFSLEEYEDKAFEYLAEHEELSTRMSVSFAHIVFNHIDDSRVFMRIRMGVENA